MTHANRHPLLCATALGLTLVACGPDARPPDRVPPVINPTAGSFNARIPLSDSGGAHEGKQDLDGDGSEDCWRAFHSKGGGLEGVTLSVQLGCEGPMSTFSTVAPQARLALAVPLPLEYRLKPAMLLGAIDLLFGEEHLRRIASQQPFTAPMADGSLAWLVDRHRIRPMGTRSPFFEVRAYAPQWVPGRPTVPEPEVVVLTAPRDRKVLEGLGILTEAPRPIPGLDKARAPHTLVVYRGQLHGSIQPAGSCHRWELQTTGRSIGVYDGQADHFSWVWTAEEAPDRIHASFYETLCIDDLVFVEPVAAATERELILIAPEAGRFGRIRLMPGETWLVDPESRQVRFGSRGDTIGSLREKLLMVNPAAPSSW